VCSDRVHIGRHWLDPHSHPAQSGDWSVLTVRECAECTDSTKRMPQGFDPEEIHNGKTVKAYNIIIAESHAETAEVVS